MKNLYEFLVRTDENDNDFEDYHSLVFPRMDTFASVDSYEVYQSGNVGNDNWIWEPIDTMGFSAVMNHNSDTLSTSMYMELWYNQSEENYDSSNTDNAIWDKMNVSMGQMQMIYKIESNSLVFGSGMTNMDMALNNND